ncbi:2-dehydro-3-deoxygalactonokinase [Aminobacter niigataensis]|uniref:2-dehydro-3-deoxygalactonokinase n=1 Tax=Aminobacter niigataensis TaxID=83265 RepID=UPI0024CC08E2|nr:2-dehydro-3-deoxygalactonokinase [Aminobacter niigataensis]CAI2932023.1 putative 2-dehydro-3-deoxygalactonokinase DgoK1 [Aminobacter niigataensis]
MSSKPTIAAVDWGTTRMRVWLLDGTGAVVDERRSDEGLLTAQHKGFASVLDRHLKDMGATDGLPAIVCGMAGARQGWIEAPYVEVPSSLSDILGAAVSVPGAGRDVRIVPGLAQRNPRTPDVMRGEETQLAGIAGLIGSGSHFVCMPGTHSKWVIAEGGAISGFGTWATGEMFSVLAQHSILRHSIGDKPAKVTPDNQVFRDWCQEALLDADIGARLFGIRAAGLLSGLGQEDAAAALSGLLIGAEIASATKRFGRRGAPVILVVSGPLGALYAEALRLDDIDVTIADADEAVLAGLVAAARRNKMLAEGVAR